MLYKTLMIIEDLNRQSPFTLVVHNFYLIMLDKAFRETKGRIIIGFREEQSGGRMKCVGVTVGIFSVKVTVKHEADTVYRGRLFKGVCDSLSRLSKVAVIVTPDSSVCSV